MERPIEPFKLFLGRKYPSTNKAPLQNHQLNHLAFRPTVCTAIWKIWPQTRKKLVFIDIDSFSYFFWWLLIELVLLCNHAALIIHSKERKKKVFLKFYSQYDNLLRKSKYYLFSHSHPPPRMPHCWEYCSIYLLAATKVECASSRFVLSVN